jgi:hypothetical protein
MRVLFTLLISSSVLALMYLDDPSWVTTAEKFLSQSNESILLNKEVRIEGLSTLSRTEIERVLPVEKSIPWWIANRPVVEARVAENPKVKGAVVESCPGGWFSEWGCFVITIQERVPKYVGSIDDKLWLMSDDGAFMSPIEKPSASNRSLEGIIRLDGLASQSNSPDLLRHQLALVQSSAERLERAVGRDIGRIGFEGHNDLVVWFRGLEFPVVFGVAGESAVPLEEQAARFQALLGQIGQRVSEVARIDLAFSKVGSISLKPPPVNPPKTEEMRPR